MRQMVALFQERLNLLPTICGQQSNFDTVLCIDRWSLNLIKSQFTSKGYRNRTAVIFPLFHPLASILQSSSKLDGWKRTNSTKSDIFDKALFLTAAITLRHL